MLIQSHFNPSLSMPLLRRYSQAEYLLGGLGQGPADQSVLSPQAQLFMMIAAWSQMLGGFESAASVPFAPAFGAPGGGGTQGFGPMSCFLGVGPESRAQTSAPSAPRAVSKQKPRDPFQSLGCAVRPLAQSNSVSCGQASVAMSVNALTGKKLRDTDISSRYGFNLIGALNAESKQAGYVWKDGGNFSKSKWPLLEKKLNREKTPVMIGLNGPEFSPSGRGHIVTLVSMEGDKVRYADPADGTIKTTTRRSIESCPSHPDGKFIFYANRK